MSLSLDRNHLFIVIVIALLLASLLAYILGSQIAIYAVEKLYHSDQAVWQALMPHREMSALEDYQVKALRLIRDITLISLASLLTLSWVLWDNRGARFSLQALALPGLNLRTLTVLSTSALILLSIRGHVPFLLPLLAGLLTLLARESWQPFARFNDALAWLLRREVSLPLVLFLAILSFLVKFPPAQFDSLIFFDDYPTIYTVTLKGWEILKQGGIFGWDSRLMGGYHTVSDVSHNEIFFLLPFLPFGPRIGFHLMIMFFYILFPFLLYWYAKLEFGEERLAILALWIGLFTVFGFFDNLLYWGMVNSFIGLNFMLLNLALFALMRQRKPYASFFLILSLSLTLYAAVGFFAYSLLLLAIDFLFHAAIKRRFEWEMIGRLAFVMIATFLITLTFTYPFLRFPDYFIQSDEIYAPVHYGVREILDQSAKALSRFANSRLWLLGQPVRYQGVFIVSIPILLSLAWSHWHGRAEAHRAHSTTGNASRAALKSAASAAVIMVISLLVSPSVDMFVSRIRFVLPVVLALAYAAWLNEEKQLHPAPFFIVLTILTATLPSRLSKSIPHEQSLRAYNSPLIDQIEALDSDLLLLESMGGYDLATEGAGSTQTPEEHVHLESYFPLETSKNYLANNQEGYHHSIYRRNFITSGAFRGRLLTDWPAEEIKEFLSSWGIRHLVLWSDIAKDYFGSDADFRQLWTDGFWSIYEYADAIPGDVVAEKGGGEIIVKSYFEQRVELNDVRNGDLITLRMNYFPAWRAYYGDRELALQDNRGFMAFLAPDDGSYSVELRYPRYTSLSILALVVILASFLLSWRYRGIL